MGLSEKQIYETLKVACEKLQGEWRLEGSANLYLQGIDVSVRDIDITTGKEVVDAMPQLFFDCQVTRNNEKGFYRAATYIDGVEVEVIHYDDNRLNMLDKKKIKTWKQLNIPLLPLDYALIFYELIGRTEKVNLIKKFISSRNTFL